MQNTAQSDRGILALCLSGTLVFALGYYEIPPILSWLVVELGLTFTSAGSLMSIFGAMGLVFTLVWSAAISRWGLRGTGILGYIIFGIGNWITAFSPTYELLIIGRLVAGIGGQSLPVIGATTVSQRFAGHRRGSALGIYSVAVPSGTLIALNLYSLFASLFGWRSPLILTALITSILALFFYRTYPSTDPNNSSNPFSLRKIVIILSVIYPIVIMWGAYRAIGAAYNTFALLYYELQGFTYPITTLFTSIFTIGTLLLSPVFGRILYRDKHIIFSALVGCSGLAVAFGIFVFLPEVLGLGLILLLCSAPLITLTLFTSIPRLLDSDSLSLGYSITVVAANIGRTIGPFMMGWGLDVSSGYSIPFMGLILLAVLPFLVLLFSLPRKMSTTTQ